MQGSVGQSTMSSVPAATHVRTLRKGSTDQLAINIDVESERLINNEGIDEDKGLHSILIQIVTLESSDN
jgi:hypothetical protein